MHEAYELVELVKLSVQAESIAAFNDHFLLGTRQGHLLMYNVCFDSENKPQVELLRYIKSFSKRLIQKLEVIPEYQLLISLSDIICIHDMTLVNFEVIRTLHRTRGATAFALDTKIYTSLTGGEYVALRLCVAVKKKLQMYYWKNRDFLDMCDDITVEDTPKALAWCGETICVGFKGEYTLVQLSGNQQELFPTGKHQEPQIVKLSDTTFALGKDMQCILMNNNGDPMHNYAVKWSKVPVAITYDEPYLVALLVDSAEVRTIEPCGLVQSLPLSNPRLVLHCVDTPRVYVVSSEHVWCLKSVPLVQQIDVLLKERQFQLALKLTNNSKETDEHKKRKVHDIQKLYALELFTNKQFHKAMKEFIKLNANPYEVIALFPDLMPQHSHYPQAELKLQDRDLEIALLALVEFLTEVRHKLMGDTTNNNDNTESIHPKTRSKENNPTKKLLKTIDTTLLKCYLQTNDALVAPLLRLNQCSFQETEKTLKKYQKHRELIILYHTKKLHRKALELLLKQADQTDCSLHGYEKILQYLQHLGKNNLNLIFEYAGWVLDHQPEEGLKVFTEDILEVEQLPRQEVLNYLIGTHSNLVIPYLEHVVHVWEDQDMVFHNLLIQKYLLQLRDQESAHDTRNKLLNLLEKSNHYSPETVLVGFPHDRLFEEKAIVLGKLCQHEEALVIYTSILKDVPRAITYCDKMYKQGSRDIYDVLMKLLINSSDYSIPQSGEVKLEVNTVLNLLDEHADKIHPRKILEILPNDIQLHRIKHFLELSLHNTLNGKRKSQVLKGLLFTEHLQLLALIMKCKSQKVILMDCDLCRICKKRFGNQTAFVRYPNGEIIHYSCQAKTNLA